MTATRIIVSGATTAITRRTTMRKAFLAPWHPLVRDIILFSFADAQDHCEVELHHVMPVVTHFHATGTPTKDNLPDLMRRVDHDISCALNTLLARERYDAPGQLWDGREPHYMRLLDEAAQASQLVYEQINCVAAGLVERPEHMPDYTFDFGVWKTGYIEVERPDVYFSKRRPKRRKLIVTPPPLLLRAFGGNLDRLVHHMNKLREDAIRAVRRARRRPVLGVKRVGRMHPWDEPRTLRESGGARVPTFRIGARGIVGRQLAVDAARETTWFRRRHEEVRVARRDGDLSVAFPFGTYGARVVQGAPVDPVPPYGAIVTQPGPTLADVMAELERGERDEGARERSFTLVDEVRGAFVDEAREIVAHTELDFEKSAGIESGGGGRASSRDGLRENAREADEEREDGAPMVVRRRLDKHRVDRAEARRVVRLRDRRRGRPPRGGGTHGSDPPV